MDLIRMLRELKPTQIKESGQGYVVLNSQFEPIVWTPLRELAQAIIDVAKEGE